MVEEIHLTKKEIKDFNKFVSQIWSKINYKIDNISWTRYATELYNLNKLETKEHDRFRPENIKRNISIKEEAKYFSTLWLLRYVYDLDTYKPDAKDYLTTKKSIFYAYSIALNYGDKIKEVVNLEDANKINSVSYTQLI